jgi:hypothetical protein
MSSSRIVLDFVIVLVAACAVGYFIVRLVKRGISQKYQRPTSDKVHSNPWNALSAGDDPSIGPSK